MIRVGATVREKAGNRRVGCVREILFCDRRALCGGAMVELLVEFDCSRGLGEHVASDAVEVVEQSDLGESGGEPCRVQ